MCYVLILWGDTAQHNTLRTDLLLARSVLHVREIIFIVLASLHHLQIQLVLINVQVYMSN